MSGVSLSTGVAFWHYSSKPSGARAEKKGEGVWESQHSNFEFLSLPFVLLASIPKERERETTTYPWAIPRTEFSNSTNKHSLPSSPRLPNTHSEKDLPSRPLFYKRRGGHRSNSVFSRRGADGFFSGNFIAEDLQKSKFFHEISGG